MVRRLKRLCADDSGATALEYSLIATFVFLVIIASLRAIGTNLSSVFARVANNLG
jgi:pilus assembly protein Flp/PilA